MSVRFAPSPTGKFHVGNLRTAWISYQLSRHFFLDEVGSKAWVVRCEDIDLPRVVAGAFDGQLADLKKLGLIADKTYFQTQNITRHFSLFQRAVESGAVYPCFCSRRQIKSALQGDSVNSFASAPHGSAVQPSLQYSGHCRSLAGTNRIESESVQLDGVTWRFKNRNVMGADDFSVARTKNCSIDAIVRADRANDVHFVPGYQWACAIDDFDGKYDLLVRAWDLAPAFSAQLAIQNLIAAIEGISNPCFPKVFHTSLLVSGNGSRLEKRTKGITLDELLEQHSLSDLLDRFTKSFKMPVILPEAGGESRKTLSIDELLL